MSITLTYDGTLSRVRIAVAGLTATTPVTVDRSTDQVTWTTVRGGANVSPTGGAVTLDDYEFAPDVPNYYRVVGASRWDAFGRTVSNGWGTADSGQAWSVSAGAAADFSVSAGAGRQSHGVTNAYRRMMLAGTFVDAEVVRDATTPVALTGGALATGTVLRLVDTSNYYWLRCEFNPGASTIMAKISKRVAGVETTLATVDGVPGLTYTPGVPMRTRARIVGSRLYLRIWTASSPEPEAWTLTATDASVTGAGQVGELSWLVGGNTNTLPVVVGIDNWSLTYPSAVLESAQITASLGGVWLKSLARPFLNRRVAVTDWTDATRPARTGVFDVMGRSAPVAVNELRGSRRWSMEVLTSTLAEASDMAMLLASGDPLLVHVPASWPARGGYVTVGDAVERHAQRASVERLFTLPLTEVAAPGPDVVGATGNWQTVINTFATWGDVLAAHSTWSSLLELVGSPADVIVS